MKVNVFKVVLGLNRLTVPNLLTFARSVKKAMSGNAYFPSPNPGMGQLDTAINNLNDEKTAPLSPGKAARVRQRAIELRGILKNEGFYVERIANSRPLEAESIILSGGMRLKKQRQTPPKGFRIKTVETPGEVKMRTDSEPRATFAFEASTTPNDENSFVELYAGTRASFWATGLESGKRYYFRVRKINKDGKGQWSNLLSIIIP